MGRLIPAGAEVSPSAGLAAASVDAVIVMGALRHIGVPCIGVGVVDLVAAELDRVPEPIAASAAAVLADGGAEQVPDAVGEGQAEGSADDEPQDSAADVAATQSGAEGTGQTESNQDDGKSDRYP